MQQSALRMALKRNGSCWEPVLAPPPNAAHIVVVFVIVIVVAIKGRSSLHPPLSQLLHVKKPQGEQRHGSRRYGLGLGAGGLVLFGSSGLFVLGL